MKVKRRLFWCNPYSWLVGFLVFAISLGSYVMFSNFFHNWTHVGFEAAMESAHFDFYPMHGYTLIQLIGPLLAGISVLPVLRLKRCMPNIYLRTEHGYRFFLKRTAAYIVYGCVLMYAAYVIFLLIGALNLPILYTVDRYLFVEITGWEFSNQHPILYYLLEGFVRYVLFMSVYGLFSVALSFLTDKDYLCILIPMIYYNFLAIAVSALEGLVQVITQAELMPNLLFLAPTYTVMSNARAYVNGFAIIFPLLPVIAFSVLVIVYRIRWDHRRDAYGVR